MPSNGVDGVCGNSKTGAPWGTLWGAIDARVAALTVAVICGVAMAAGACH